MVFRVISLNKIFLYQTNDLVNKYGGARQTFVYRFETFYYNNKRIKRHCRLLRPLSLVKLLLLSRLYGANYDECRLLDLSQYHISGGAV